jgi:hypothetical protein
MPGTRNMPPNASLPSWELTGEGSTRTDRRTGCPPAKACVAEWLHIPRIASRLSDVECRRVREPMEKGAAKVVGLHVVFGRHALYLSSAGFDGMCGRLKRWRRVSSSAVAVVESGIVREVNVFRVDRGGDGGGG